MSTTRHATTHHISPTTVTKVFTTLVDENLLAKERGIGMFVTADVREHLRTVDQVRFTQGSLLSVVEEALTFGLTPSDLIDAIHIHAQSAETHTKGY